MNESEQSMFLKKRAMRERERYTRKKAERQYIKRDNESEIELGSNEKLKQSMSHYDKSSIDTGLQPNDD